VWEIKCRSDLSVLLLCVSLFGMTMIYRPLSCKDLIFCSHSMLDQNWIYDKELKKNLHAIFHQNTATRPISLRRLSPGDTGVRTGKSCCWIRGILNRFICLNYMVAFNSGFFYRWLAWSFLVQLAAGCLEFLMIFRQYHFNVMWIALSLCKVNCCLKILIRQIVRK
jgi:hypothetical protein